MDQRVGREMTFHNDFFLTDDAGHVAAPAVTRSKRVLDIVLALLLVVPVLILIVPAAIAIKATSRGPIFFRQLRNGQGKVPFVIYKLRTMSHSPDTAVFRQAVKGDQRITKVGAFLRKTSIDELPQILNVLKGDMSIVGPRPHALAHDEQYRRLIPNYDLRFRVRPGITGLAQVRGHRGPTETLDVMTARVRSDIEYTETVSVLRDFQILLATVRVVLLRTNAF